MSETPLQVRITRRAVHGLVADDTPAVRAWLQQIAADHFALTGALPPTIRLLGDGFAETIDLGPILEPGGEPYVAALFVSIDRPEVRRRVREGELLVDGGKRKAIAVLEWGPDGRFWLAWRLVGVGAQRVGVFHSEWNTREGVGLEALGEPFAEWADAGGQALAGVQTGPMAPVAPPEIAGQFGELPQPAPVDATALADVLGWMFDVEIASGALKTLVIVVFSGRQFERYEVSGELPCPIDDLIRAIVARGDPTGVALIHLAVIQTPQGPLRGFSFAIESGGKRLDRVLMLRKGPNGETQKRVMLQDRGDSEGTCWLGVPPASGTIDLFPLGPTGEA